MKKHRIALSMFVVATILGTSVTTYSIGKNDIIGKIANFKVLIEGEELVSQHPIVSINDTTYLPLKDIGTALGVKINWNTDKRQIEVEQKNIATEIVPLIDSNGLELTYTHPKNNSQNINLTWGYMQLAFNEQMRGVKNVDKIYLIDEFGNRVKVISGNPGTTAKDVIILSLNEILKLDTNYKLYVPKDTIVSKEGKTYGLEISLDFKTASNVVKGKIDSKTNYFGSEILLINQQDTYSSRIIGTNEFIFADIPEGKYDVLLSHNGQQDIVSGVTVTSNKINNFIIK